MSTAPTIPVLNPATGDVHAIPTDQVDQARAAGGKPVATMLDPQGVKRYVPMDQVGDAQKAGGKLIPYGSPSSTEAAQDITGIHPDNNPVTSGLEGIGRTIKGVVTAPWEAAKSAFAPPTNTEETAAEGAAGPLGLAADRMVVQPAKSAFSTARSLYGSGHPIAAAGAALGAIPFLGPQGASLGNRAAAGDITGAVTEGVSSALVPKAAEEAGGAVSRFANKGQQLIPGENYTAAHHQALSSALARGTGMGKDFIAPDVATDIGSRVRQAAADNPALAQAIQKGTPKDALGATQRVLQEAQNQIDTQHNAARAPVANQPVDMKPVQNAIPAPKRFYTDAESKSLGDLKDRVGKVQTLDDLNDFRQYLNKETAPQYRESAIAAGRSSIQDDALMNAATAARNHYYDSLQDATGLDFQPAKRQEAGLMKAQEALQNATPGLVNKDVIANEDKGKVATAADVLEGGTKITHGGLPVVGYAAEKLRGTPLDQMHRQLKTAFSDLPKPSAYRGPLTSQVGRAQPKLPANVPANVETGGTEGNWGTPPPGPAVPSTITPTPIQPPQLPAQAGPAGQGVPPGRNITVAGTTQPPHGTIPLPSRFGQPLLGSGEGNPQFVTPRPSPPPPVNLPTAQTSVNAGRPLVRPIDRPVEEPSRPINLPRQLPPPETHAFSQKAWQAAHPNGNLKTAIKQAQAKGYRVLE